MIDSMPMHEGRQLPKFTLREIDLPDILGWEVNSQHYLVVKVSMQGKEVMKDLDAPKSDRQKVEAYFEVMSIKPLGMEPVDVNRLEQEDFQKALATALHG